MSRTEVLTGMKRKRVCYLEVNSPDRPKLNYKLGEMEVVIGRTKDNHVTLPFSNVSRHHAGVNLSGEDYFVADKGSTNGTYVNGVKVAKCNCVIMTLFRLARPRFITLNGKNSVCDG
jgi:pSer/pThr/pTyr-binding forkhead associated (FHA) protein